ncbi:MAG: M15 family metallopeptidase [Burkholderiales bacterium]|nr:M15 family metallopeptidase [Burkholderiales bacterium]
MFDELQITGRARTHVVQHDVPRFAAHPEVAAAFLRLRAAAARDGIDLRPYSSFRGYDAQVRIWSAKFSGRAPLYDLCGRPRDRAGMGEDDVIGHILDWSALPGASRHQWGTEIDVVDGAVMPPGYKPQLLPAEVADGGLFAPLHRWLDAHIHEHGFFRPYARFQGGMFPEPWHLSYAPVSMRAIDDLTLEILRRCTEASDIPGRARVLERLPEIFERHVRNIVPPPAECRW